MLGWMSFIAPLWAPTWAEAAPLQPAPEPSSCWTGEVWCFFGNVIISELPFFSLPFQTLYFSFNGPRMIFKLSQNGGCCHNTSIMKLDAGANRSNSVWFGSVMMREGGEGEREGRPDCFHMCADVMVVDISVQLICKLFASLTDLEPHSLTYGLINDLD